jgi:hypothetical protein
MLAETQLSHESGKGATGLIRQKRRSLDGTTIVHDYGETGMFTRLLTMLPDEAVMVTVPVVWFPATSVTMPAETVARLVLLDVHVATLVMSN